MRSEQLMVPCLPSMDSKPKLRDNGNGGGPTMRDNDYVTHQKLELSSEKLLRHY